MFKTLTGWLKKKFYESEVKKGKILVIWRDVDNVTYGWMCSADNEYRLTAIAKIIDRTKVIKLRRMVVGTKKGENGYDTTLPDCFTEDS